VIRLLGPDDVEAIAALERGAVTRPWSVAKIVDEMAAGGICVGAFVGDALAGWMALRDQAGELWLFEIAVAPGHRRRGVGRRLLQHAINAVWDGEGPFLLEVRASNEGAQALYRAQGFAEVARRPGYYPVPGGPDEAAVLMQLLP
jgi:ribosomal-protein-alanine N-acetyltransferase